MIQNSVDAQCCCVSNTIVRNSTILDYSYTRVCNWCVVIPCSVLMIDSDDDAYRFTDSPARHTEPQRNCTVRVLRVPRLPRSPPGPTCAGAGQPRLALDEPHFGLDVATPRFATHGALNSSRRASEAEPSLRGRLPCSLPGHLSSAPPGDPPHQVRPDPRCAGVELVPDALGFAPHRVAIKRGLELPGLRMDTGMAVSRHKRIGGLLDKP